MPPAPASESSKASGQTRAALLARSLPPLALLGAIGFAALPPTQLPLQWLAGKAPPASRDVAASHRNELSSEGLRPDPLDFSSEELTELNRRFGVHGQQSRLAQLFTEGLDQLQPLRSHTFGRIEELRPLILAESSRQGINPMLVAAVLFDEMQHAKPGEDHPLAVRSGLFSTQGPAQLSVGEMVKQGLLRPDASPAEVTQARLNLLDPDRNVQLLVGKFARLSKALNLPRRTLMASRSPHDAKALATLAYLHNGKLDYPGRILRYMQDPELHATLFSRRPHLTSPLI